MAFTIKRLHVVGRIGQDLRELRTRAGWSVEQVARVMKFTPSFLYALEEERWNDVPDPAYAERMLRAYVTFLGGNVSYFTDKYRACLNDRRLERRPEDHLPRPSRVRFLELTAGSRWVTIVAFVMVLLILTAYVFIQVNGISAEPLLDISSPIEGLRVDEPHVTITGRTLPESALTVNGTRVVVQPDGYFSFTMAISRGVTEIHIMARKRYGKETERIRHVIYDRTITTQPTTTESL